MSSADDMLRTMSTDARTRLLLAVNRACETPPGYWTMLDPVKVLLVELDRVNAWRIVAELLVRTADDLRAVMLAEVDALAALEADLS